MSNGESKKDTLPPAEKGDRSPESPEKSEISKWPKDSKSPTSVPPVDSDGQRRNSPSKAVDPPRKFAPKGRLVPTDDTSLESYYYDMAAFSQFHWAHEAPPPLPPLPKNQYYGFDPLEDNEANRSLFRSYRRHKERMSQVSRNTRLADDSKKETEEKTPVGNKTQLSNGKHALSSAKKFSKKPWGCEKEPLLFWLDDFNTSPYLIPLNIERSCHQFSAHREIRGDGNGFYRAFIFGYMEHILESKDMAEVARLKESIKECKITMEKLEYRFDSSTFDDTVEKLSSLISGTDVSISSTDIMKRAFFPELSDSMGQFLRYVTAAEIRKRNDIFYCFFMHYEKGAEKYCETNVLPMGVEANEFHMMGLCSALGVPVRVVYLDRYGSDTEAFSSIYSTLPPLSDYFASLQKGTSGTEHIQPRFTLAFRPGQFDILYPKEKGPLE